MKNKMQMMNQCSHSKILDWLCQEEPEDDFLLGKAPGEFQDILEREE